MNPTIETFHIEGTIEIEAPRETADAVDLDIGRIKMRYVEANKANDNGHVFPLDELAARYKSLEGKPLNLLHKGAEICGHYTTATLVYPTNWQEPAGQMECPSCQTQFSDITEEECPTCGWIPWLAYPDWSWGGDLSGVGGFGERCTADKQVEVPRAVSRAAKQGIAAAKKLKMAPTSAALATSAALVKGSIPAGKARQMARFFQMNRDVALAAAGTPEAATHQMWGGNPGKAWTHRVSDHALKAALDTVDNPYVEASADFYKYYFPRLWAEVQTAHKAGQAWTSMEAVPQRLTCMHDGCFEEYAYAGRSAKSYTCGHMDSPQAERMLHDFRFTAGAVVIPPALPGWRQAHMTEVSDASRELTPEQQVAEMVSRMTDAEWLDAISLVESRILTLGADYTVNLADQK